MREFFITANSVSADWLVFLGILMLICFAIAIVAVWLTVFRTKGKRRRKHRHHRHHRHNSGSPLSARGGLPPRREPPDDAPVLPP